MPAIVLADGMIGQMMEGIVLPPEKTRLPERDWTAGRMYARGPFDSRPTAPRHEARHITSIHLVPDELEAATRARFARYETVKADETRFDEIECDSADLVLAAYGTSARVCLGARMLAKKEGIRLGVFRPVTLWPFPYRALAYIAKGGRPILAVEMSLGQFVEDVKLSVFKAIETADADMSVNFSGVPVNTGISNVHLLGHSGGVIPTEEAVFAEAKRILGK
jgi:2-oxoglutarate ferredoxin oxidoreductase subunit alpha